MLREIIFFFKLIKLKKKLINEIILAFSTSVIIPILEVVILSVFILNLNFLINENAQTGILNKIFEWLNLDISIKNYYQITIYSTLIVFLVYFIYLLYEYFILKVGAKIFSQVKRKTIKLLMQQNMDIYLKNDQSKQIQIVANELNSVYVSYLGVTNIIKTCSLFLFFSIFLLLQNFDISIKIIITIIFINLGIFLLTRKKFKLYGSLDFKESIFQNSRTTEIIKNLFAIKQFNLINYMNKINKTTFDSFAFVRFKNVFLIKKVKLFIEFIIYFSSLSIILFFLKNKNLLMDNLEIISATFFAILRLAPLANSINGNISQILKFNDWLKPINKYLNEIVESKKDIKSKNFIQASKIEGDIDVTNLKITNNNKLLINKFNHNFKKGDFIFLKGDVGSGKSTLIKVLSKYFTEYEGDIKYNNINLRDLDDNLFSNSVKYISQDDLLFNETIEFNITLEEHLSEKDKIFLNKLYTIVDLENFLKTRDTVIEKNKTIGESGIRLSGGEKQKILIARCLFQSPKYLFLDESFSNINKLSAEKILDNLNKNYPQMTIILISHQKFEVNFNHRTFEIKNKNLLEL